MGRLDTTLAPMSNNPDTCAEKRLWHDIRLLIGYVEVRQSGRGDCMLEVCSDMRWPRVLQILILSDLRISEAGTQSRETIHKVQASVSESRSPTQPREKRTAGR